MQRVGVLMPFAPPIQRAGWIAATSASIIAGQPTIPTACAARGRGGGRCVRRDPIANSSPVLSQLRKQSTTLPMVCR
jgi:hypothetical protein